MKQILIKDRPDIKAPEWAKKYTKAYEISCEWCRGLFVLFKISERKRNRGRFCGRKCVVEWVAAEKPPPKKPKQAARSLVYLALKKGDIRKPNKCEICGREGKIQAHHKNYQKPLDVEWLCTFCHAKHHAHERKQAKVYS